MVKAKKQKYLRKGHPEVADWIRNLLMAWLTAATVEFYLLPADSVDLRGLQCVAQMSFLRLLLVTGAVAILLRVFSQRIKLQMQRAMVLTVILLLTAGPLMGNFGAPLFAACLLLIGIALFYYAKGWNGDPLPEPSRGKSPAVSAVTAVLALGFFLFVSVWTVSRVYSFSTPTFDFGIFSQMFHSMATSGQPITTVERDGPLSHFAVHVSPIYYLLLPLYMIAPRPETLQILQAAVLASAVIPLYRIAKRHGLPPVMRMAVCALLLLYPAYSGGASYDIHENAFLTPLILWLFDAVERRNIPTTVLFAALTMMVKEDAPVYVAVLGLWLLVHGLLRRSCKWERRAGCLLLAASVFYFLCVTAYLANAGDGVMTYRYKNFMYDGSSSLVTVIKAVLLAPMKAVYECVDPSKLHFIGLTLLPLAGIPLLTRRYERLLLLIPYILVNLMSDYQYQHDIFFQYTYGSTAFLFYLTAVNFADIKNRNIRIGVLAVALAMAAMCFGAEILPKAMEYPKKCQTYEAYYDSLREVLDTVPKDASVAASTFYTTYLSQRDTLYDVRYASEEHIFSCEYVVLGVTDAHSFKPYAVNGEQGYENFLAMVLERGYEKVAEYEGRLEIYKKP